MVAVAALPVVFWFHVGTASHTGRPPDKVSRFPFDPGARNVVAPTPVWYGMSPARPPDKFAAVFALEPLAFAVNSFVVGSNSQVMPLPSSKMRQRAVARKFPVSLTVI